MSLDKSLEKGIQQGHIEAAVIQELRQLQGFQKAFGVQVEEILKECSILRQKQGFSSLPETSQSADISRQRQLAIRFIDFCQQVLNNLVQQPGLSSSIVRRLIDLQDENKAIFRDNQQFFQSMNQVFYQSKRLSNAVFLPIVGKVYIGDQSIVFSNIEFSKKQVDIDETTALPMETIQPQLCYLTSGENKYFLNSASKINGRHFGSVITALSLFDQTRQYERLQNERKFYVKSYSLGFPAINNQNGSDGAIPDLLYYTLFTQYEHIKVKRPNLRELLGYKILEQLQIGPETHFLVNPYIKYGLFILTKGLSDAEYTFSEEYYFPIEVNKDLRNQVLFDYSNVKEFSEYQNYYPVINLTELHLISLILGLYDMKQDNLGYVMKKSEKKFEGTIKDFYRDNKKWFIIDFLVGSTKNNKLTDKFLSGQFFHDIDSMNGAASKLLGTREQKQQDYERKYFFGKLALDRLKEGLRRYATANGLLGKQDAAEAKAKQDTGLNSAFLREEVRNSIAQRRAADDDYDLTLRYLLQSEARAIKDLMLVARGESEEEAILRHPTEKVEGTQRLRSRTNAELIGFGSYTNFTGQEQERVDGEPLDMNIIEDAFVDLNDYCREAMRNYELLNEFITSNYNKHFDLEGNLKAERAPGQ